MKRYPLLFLIGILVLTSLACSITVNAPEVRFRTGPTQTLDIQEEAPNEPARLTLSMGAGELEVSPGGSGFVSGSIRYNVEELKPEVERSGNQVSIGQNEKNFPSAIGTDLINDWNLRLGTATPVALTINAGAYEGTIDLSGVPLTELRINDGASKAEVVFEKDNPVEMERLSYKTGASQVKLTGLGYANFKELTFGGGAGDYTLDFTGQLRQDARATITSGVSSVKIIVPNGMRAKVILNGGLNNVDQRGTWTVGDHQYETNGSGPLLTISVEMGVGNLELIQR